MSCWVAQEVNLLQLQPGGAGSQVAKGCRADTWRFRHRPSSRRDAMRSTLDQTRAVQVLGPEAALTLDLAQSCSRDGHFAACTCDTSRSLSSARVGRRPGMHALPP